MGLLASAEANLFKQTKGLAFCALTKKYNLNMFAILTKSCSNYFINQSIGFDGESLLKSYSTQSFWEGTILDEEKLYKFSKEDGSINTLLQFLSSKMNEKIKFAEIFRSGSNIFISVNSQITQELKQDLKLLCNKDKEELLTSNDKGRKININFSEAISSYLEMNCKDSELAAYAEKALFFALLSKLCKLCDCDKYNYSVQDKSLSVLFKVTDVSENLLVYHLVMNFKELIGNSAEIIDIEISGDF